MPYPEDETPRPSSQPVRAWLTGGVADGAGAAEEVLREVHDRYKGIDATVCAFNWRNGQPALVDSAGRMTLGQTIEHCADAIERDR
ncbi:MAG TPA: hypothetical protein VNH18_22820 [Bryobacteraceae bacterium]|nr:hypothetical protein [Bryobacteraceae bacterium]